MDKPLINKLSALNKLVPSTKQLWGKMYSQHMVEHLMLAVRCGNGKLKVECFNSLEKIPALKGFLLSQRPLPKEFINPLVGEGLLPLQYKSLDEAKSVLTTEIEDYYKFFENHPNAVLVNPTFGELNKQEWDVFHEKHFNHHYKQFGIES